VRVVTFNACHGSAGKATPTDTEGLVDACVGFEADVLAVQELDRGTRRVNGVDQAALVARATGMAHLTAPVKRYDEGWVENALLVRGSVTDGEVLALRGRCRLGRRERRSAVVATAWLRDRAVSVAATHLSLTIPDNEPQQDRVVAALVRRPGPHLLLGDLNRRTAWVRAGTARAGLALVDDDAPTFPAPNPRYRIDHVAVGGLVVTGVEVVLAPVSDHRAVVVEIA
jgi:endonuclease/exonuclease/phosphatase family metal-dependent hydrolase